MELIDFDIKLNYSLITEEWILNKHEFLREWIMMTYVYIKSKNLADDEMSEIKDQVGVYTFDCRTRFNILKLADSLQKKYIPFSSLDIRNKNQEYQVMIEIYNYVKCMLKKAEKYFGELSVEGQVLKEIFIIDRDHAAKLVFDFAVLEQAYQS